MDTDRGRTTTLIVVVGIITLMIGLCCGVFIGGLGGLLLSRASADRALQVESGGSQQDQLVIPSMPELPSFPGDAGASGALVREVMPGSPADEAGLQVGDLISGVDDTAIDADHLLSELLGTYMPGQQVRLEVTRDGDTQTITVQLGERSDGSIRPYLGIRYTDLDIQSQPPQD